MSARELRQDIHCCHFSSIISQFLRSPIPPILIPNQLTHSSVLHLRSCVEVDITSQHQVPSVFSNLVFAPLTPRSALYAVLYEHWATVSAIVESSMGSMISNRTWKDSTPGLTENLQGKLTGVVVFKTIPELVIQYAETLHLTHRSPLTSQ